MTDYLLARGADNNAISTILVLPVLDKRYIFLRHSNPIRLEIDLGN
jgi:hypothetical protein